MLKRHVYRANPAFSDAFFLDSGTITGGERRKKLIVLPSYRTSVISFVDKKILKKDLNNHFYVQHPELEVCGVKLTHLRKIKNELLVYALEDDSPLELSTLAHAYWYFERLVIQGMVSKANRKVLLAACTLLAIKFLETGDVSRKLQYFHNRWRLFHFVSGMLVGSEAEEDEDNIKVDWKQVERNEFPVYVGLDFTLLPDLGSNVITTHIERLLQQINVTFQEYYSKKFVSPGYLNKYNYYSNLYY
ncbi:unnamed protein product [Phytomonas sp. Hart1]|nr:unnamed protein product [Phytomonas sp. Hart1]|eukprot:CCW68612.1 unnamed protein product [Phytomonas sp. isolate Hart1]